MREIFIGSKLNNTTAEDIYNKFIIQRKALNLSDDTIKYYDRCFKSFVHFYGKDRCASEINKDTYFEYMGYLRRKDTSDKFGDYKHTP